MVFLSIEDQFYFKLNRNSGIDWDLPIKLQWSYQIQIILTFAEEDHWTGS